MLFLQVILHCILCYSLGSLAYHPVSAKTDIDVEGHPADGAADEPSLLHMLDFFKGKSDVGKLTTFLKQYKAMVEIFKGAMEICVPCKEVLKDVAKTNAGIRILNKMAQGQAPDIKDMYDLATKRIGNIADSLHAALRKNKKYKKIINLLKQGSASFSSVPLMEELLSDVTGQEITLDPELVEEVREGQVNYTKSNIAQVNLLFMMSIWADNFALIQTAGHDFKGPPYDFIKFMKTIQTFDSSNLSKIKAISATSNDNKYSVSHGGGAILTDPGAAKFLQDFQMMKQFLKTKSQDQSKAESLFIAAVSDLTSLTLRTIKNAENPMKLPPV